MFLDLPWCYYCCCWWWWWYFKSMLYHFHRAINFHSDWPRNANAGAPQTSWATPSLSWKEDRGPTSSLIVLTALIKSPSFSASVLTQFFHIHPPLDILLIFSCTCSFTQKETFHLLSSFFLILAAHSPHPSSATIPYPPTPKSPPTRCPPGEVLRARMD